MKQKKLLMVAGPVEIEQEISDIGSAPQEYMRTEEYSKKWKRIFENLQYIFQTKFPVVCYASSGTGAMDAAVTNFLSFGDTVAFINAGSFGKRWGNIAQKHGINSIEIPTKFGDITEIEDVKNILDKNLKIKVLFATLNETSCGSLQNIEKLGNLLKHYPEVLFVVDCISGLCSDKFLMDKWNVDVAVSASQKALALPPGLSFMAVNDKALKFAENANLRTFYFDILEYLKDRKRNQTPFTAATGIVNQLDIRLQKIKKEGLENFQKRYHNNTQYLREKLAELGLKTFVKSKVNCVTAIWTDKYNASEIVRIMRNKYNIELAPSGGELSKKMFRIGTYGNIGKEEIDKCISCLKSTIKEIDKNGNTN